MATPRSQEPFLARLLRTAYPHRKVPAERGVRFRISPPAGDEDDGVCLLFRLDDDGLVPAGTARPDWLVLFVGRHGWVFTLVELKNDKTNGDHAVTQIEQGWTWLREQLREALPCLDGVVQWQGIILTAYNVEVPKQRLARLQRRLSVRHEQAEHAVDLRSLLCRVTPAGQRKPADRTGRTPGTDFNVIDAPLSTWERRLHRADAERTHFRYLDGRHRLDLHLEPTALTMVPGSQGLHERLTDELTRLGFKLTSRACPLRLETSDKD